ncbi:MAG: glycoside hydrolase N-terminal domain-containing protein [Armatimonadetes bacterium]|nr:glycoside hydrolase N-terminal domain-containing protein [Armatimonadota bacterium]
MLITTLGAALLAASPTLVWYDKPADRDWHAAFPMGNGRLGAMVHGNPEHEVLALNDNTLYALEPETSMFLPDIRPKRPEITALLRAGRHAEAQELVRANWLGRSNAPYQPLGDLLLDLDGAGAVTDYRRELDLAEAVARVRYRRGDVTYQREAFVSHPDQAIVVHLTADRPGTVSFTLRLDTQHKPTAKWHGVDADTLVLAAQGPGEALRRDLTKNVEAWGDQRKYPAFYEPDGAGGWQRRFADPDKRVLYGAECDGRGTFFQMRARVFADGGQLTVEGQSLRLVGADRATVILCAATSFNGFDKSPSRQGRDPEMLCTRQMKAASRPYAELRARHVADHRALFDRLAVRLGPITANAELPTDERIRRYATDGDPALAALYYQFSRYLMIAGSRPGGQPLNLQGIWNRDIIPPWNAGYTVNINTEMNYWNAARGNLGECEQPLFDLVREATVTGSRVAKAVFGARGWCMSHNCSIWREAAPVDGSPTASWWPMAGGWFCQHLWRHYEFTGDRAFLAEVYPILRGASEFFLDWLTERADGVLVTPVSTSPENTFVYQRDGKTERAAVTLGTTMDMAICRELFTHTAEAARLLGRDAALATELDTKAARLLPYQIGAHGQLQEWDKDFDEAEVHHRHVSHLYGFFPGDEITPERAPKLVDAVRASLERRGDEATGWSMGWKLCLWARLGDGARVQALLNRLLTPRYTATNLFDMHPPFQIDGNFGAARGIAETLLWDHRDGLDLLPALPPTWPEGEVRGLRAVGGFEVDLAWRAGRLTSARIVAHNGGTAKVRYAGQAVEVKLGRGEAARLDGALRVEGQPTN